MLSSNEIRDVDILQGISLISENNIDNRNIDNELKVLHAIRENHPLWNNPLLLACDAGQLTCDDFQFLFSQYYFYSKNFTKLLAASMVNCDSDYYRSRLSANLWEEGGGQEVEKRHSEIFREFLTHQLRINLDDIQFEPYTKYFFNQYLVLCLNANPITSSAALSFGTEGIVSRLYKIFITGLKKAGFQDEALRFFHLHVECDDEHAATLEEMTSSYRLEKAWITSCEEGVIRALDLRNEFFNHIFQSLQIHKLSTLARRISQTTSDTTATQLKLQSTVNETDNPLYHNKDISQNINFHVHRVPFQAEVLDPRLVTIPQGYCNESHQHAHETVFLILEGYGEVTVDNQKTDIKPGDLIFVPRWKTHQTHNTGIVALKFFAITDYGLTKIFSQNSESVYRQKQQK